MKQKRRSIREHLLGKHLSTLEIDLDPYNPWRRFASAKINAAQASHPGRMLVDVSFTLSLPNAVRRLRETAFAEERSFLGAPFKSSIRGPESTLDDLQ